MIFYIKPEINERILLRRVYLTSIKPEALVLFTQLMNDFPVIDSKKSLSQMAGASLIFKSYKYNTGYVIEEILSQAQSKNLKYFMFDPYKESEKVFLNSLSLGFIENEKNFAYSKEKIQASEEFKKSSSIIALSLINANYSEIDFDVKLLKELTIADVNQVKEAINKATINDFYYLGNMKTKSVDTLVLPSSTPLVNEGYKVSKKKIKLTSASDESIALIFKHDEIKTTSDLVTLNHVIYALKDYLVEKLKQAIYLNYSVNYQVLDNEHTLLMFTCENNKANSLNERILPLLNNLDELYFENATLDYKISQVEETMDNSLYLKQRILINDLSLEESDDLITKEKFTKMSKSFTLSSNIVLGKENKNA